MSATKEQTLRVLLVDDESDIVSSALRNWPKLGLHVEACFNVDDARQRLLANRFGAVVSDTVVSPVTQVNVLSIAYQLYPELPRLLISGNGSEEVERKARELHATAWLTKPVAVGQLHATLARALPAENILQPGFLWREGRVVFIVGPPAHGFERACQFICNTKAEHIGLVLLDDKTPARSIALGQRLSSMMEAVGRRICVAFCSTDNQAHHAWVDVRANSRVNPRSFAGLTAAVEWVVTQVSGSPMWLGSSEMDETAVKPRVLVVDDEPHMRLLVSRFVSRLGTDVVCAASVGEAMTVLDTAAFDVAIVDKNLPGRSGMELLAFLQSKMAGVATVMMTGQPTDLTRQEARRLGAVAYLTKPFALAELEGALDGALAGVLATASLDAARTQRLNFVTDRLRELSFT